MALALNVLRENLRNRALYIMWVIALLVALPTAWGIDLDEGPDPVASVDPVLLLGLILVSFLGSMLAVVISMGTLPREVERKTIQLLAVQPVSRTRLALGFLGGNILTSWLSLVLLAVPVLVGLVRRQALTQLPKLLLAMVLLAFLIALAAALTTLLSLYLPAIATAFLAILLLVMGSLNELITLWSKSMLPFWAGLVDWLLYLLPPVDGMVMATLRLIGADGIAWEHVGHASLYLVLLIALLVAGFQRREI